jgi:osmoprotectant transport system ATP-binding protein
MIEIENVTKSLGRNLVLSNLSFQVPRGKTLSLLGLSGSGKTTALKLICGLYLPDEGRVRLNGREILPAEWTEERKSLGYVIQGGGLFPHLTAFENLWLVAKEAGWDMEKTRNRVHQLAEMTKIQEDILNQYPRELSGGQRQRIGLMRALLLDPPILLLDEPMGALDPITRGELQDELKELFHRLNKTVLLVTHDLIEAGYLADRILLLSQGRILQSGSLEELVDRPADDFVRRFVHSYRFKKTERDA